MTTPKAWNYFEHPDDSIGPSPDDPFWQWHETDRHLLVAVVLAGLALLGIVLGVRRLRR